MTEHSYRSAGVDIDLETLAIRKLVGRLTYRRSGRYAMLGRVGHFAGLVDAGDRVIALTVDGVGTKMLVADRLRTWSTVGIDCIAMNVNDLYVMHVEPVAFVDYIATDCVDPVKMEQIGEGLNEGARMANIDIVGGETATLTGLVRGLDLAGTCIGLQEKGKVITGEKIMPGDRVIGVPSTGIHSNGLTLARSVAEDAGGYDAVLRNGRSVGEELLAPTRIYHESLAVADRTVVHGMCHITGGGLLNLNRLSEYGFSITDPLPPQEIFSWIQEHGDVATNEMYRTFNMGMGYVYVVPERSTGGVLSMVPGSKIVGQVVDEKGVWLNNKEIC